MGWEQGDLCSSPSNATCSWVTLGKSPDLSEPQLQVEGNRLQKTVFEPVPSQLLRKCFAAYMGVPLPRTLSTAEGCWDWGYCCSLVAFGEG